MNYKRAVEKRKKERVDEGGKKGEEIVEEGVFDKLASTCEGENVLICCRAGELGDVLRDPETLYQTLVFINQNLPVFLPSVEFLLSFGPQILENCGESIQLLLFDILDKYICDYSELFHVILDTYQNFIFFEGDPPPNTFFAVTRILVKYIGFFSDEMMEEIVDGLTSCLDVLDCGTRINFLTFVFSVQELGEKFPGDKCVDSLRKMGEDFLQVSDEEEEKWRENFFWLLITLREFDSYEKVVCEIISLYITSHVQGGIEYPLDLELLIIKAVSAYPGVAETPDFCSLISELCGGFTTSEEGKLSLVFFALSRCLNSAERLVFPPGFLFYIIDVIVGLLGGVQEPSMKTKSSVICFLSALFNPLISGPEMIEEILGSFRQEICGIIEKCFGQREIDILIFHIMHSIYKIQKVVLGDEKSFDYIMTTYRNIWERNKGLSSEEEEALEEIFQHEIDFKNGREREGEMGEGE